MDSRQIRRRFVSLTTLGLALCAVPDLSRAQTTGSSVATAAQGIMAEHDGTLEIMHEDSISGSRYSYFLKARNGRRYTLQFTGDRPEHLLTGAQIRVKGLEKGNTLELGGGGSTVQQVAPAPVPNAFGEQRTLVILVNFSDAPAEPYTRAEAWNVMFGTTNQFYLENSFQQTWLAGDVVGWFTIAAASTTCDTAAIATQAQAAASGAGINLAGYAHHVYAFPSNYTCYFWGRSTVGGNPSQAWINGDFELGVTAHEFGHGLGLWHSHSTDCGVTTLASTCTVYEYGDTLDMMGASSFAHFNAFQKERLGWLNYGTSPSIATIQTDGAYTLQTYELPGSGPKALKILKSTDPSTGKRTWYYVQSRQAAGFDGGLAGNTNVLNGVLIHFATEANGNSSHLLDMTPESGSSIYLDWHDPALAVGQSFTDPAAGVTIIADWVTSTAAGVTVRFASTGMVAVTTDRQTYTVNDSVVVKATVRSGGVPAANVPVSFKIKKSTGAVVTGSATTGADGTAVYKLRLKRQDPVGTYEADAAALSSTAATNFTVR